MKIPSPDEGKKTGKFSRYSYGLFLFVLIFSPLAFGSVEQWSLTVLEGLSVLALLLLLLEGARSEVRPLYSVPGTTALLCLSLFMLVQLLPLPPSLVRVISPGTYRAYADTAGASGSLGWISLSLSRKATLMEFFRFMAYCSFYILTVQLLSRKEYLRKTVNVVIIFSSLLAFQAILQKFLYNGRIFWIRPLLPAGSPFGPFINRDHYAGFMGMVFPVALGMFLLFKPRVTYGSLRERMSAMFDRRETNIYVLMGLAAVVIATSVFVSLSRSGIVSLSLSMLFFGVVLGVQKRSRRRGVIVVILFSVIVVSVGWFGWSPILQRFAELRDVQTYVDDMRIIIWNDCLGIVRDFPLSGAGFGTFSSVYPKYQSWVGKGSFAEHAHNDYLELLTDGGLIAVLLAGWFLLAVSSLSVKRFISRKEPYSAYLFAGSLTGIVAMLMHSVTDFNLHIGSNGLYFFFLAGLMVSAANTRMREGVLPRTYLGLSRPNAAKGMKIVFTAILLTGLLFNGGVLFGKVLASGAGGLRLDQSEDRLSLRTARDFFRKASLADPLEPAYLAASGDASILLGDRNPAVSRYLEALMLDPLNGEYAQRLGLAYSLRGDNARAERLLKAGIAVSGTNPLRYKRYASWLFSRGEKVKAIANIREAISLEPERTRDYIGLMVLYGLDNGEIRDSLPDMVEPHLLFADYLDSTGSEDLAADEYRQAFGYFEPGKAIDASWFFRAYRYYARREQYEDALRVMQKGTEALPDHAGIRMAAAEAYEKAGIKYRAAEEYRKALILQPGNTTARRKLRMLNAD